MPHTGGFAARVRAVPDHRVLDSLLRSRAWIWLLGIALGGIVAMQVSLLGMHAGIGRAVAQSTSLEQANSALEEEVAELSGGDRIRAAAERLGLVSPDAGAVGFLTVRPGVDARRAADRMTPPSDAARQTLANDGRPTAEAPTALAAPVTQTTTTTTAAPAATATPVATETPAATATAAPVVAAPTVAPAPVTPSQSGAAAAP